VSLVDNEEPKLGVLDGRKLQRVFHKISVCNCACLLEILQYRTSSVRNSLAKYLLSLLSVFSSSGESWPKSPLLARLPLRASPIHPRCRRWRRCPILGGSRQVLAVHVHRWSPVHFFFAGGSPSLAGRFDFFCRKMNRSSDLRISRAYSVFGVVKMILRSDWRDGLSG
jgi:hypothetical protein